MTVENVSENGLERTVYRFWVNVQANIINIVFDAYYTETRATKRHKWVTQTLWSRLGYRSNSNKETLVPRPALSADIVSRAKAEAAKTIVVIEDYDRATGRNSV